MQLMYEMGLVLILAQLSTESFIRCSDCLIQPCRCPSAPSVLELGKGFIPRRIAEYKCKTRACFPYLCEELTVTMTVMRLKPDPYNETDKIHASLQKASYDTYHKNITAELDIYTLDVKAACICRDRTSRK